MYLPEKHEFHKLYLTAFPHAIKKIIFENKFGQDILLFSMLYIFENERKKIVICCYCLFPKNKKKDLDSYFLPSYYVRRSRVRILFIIP